MARTSPAPSLTDSARAAGQGQSPILTGMLFVVGGLLGLGMLVLVSRQVAQMGGGAPLVHDFLALDASHRAAGSIGAVARNSGSQLLYFAALACAAGASLTLLVGAGLATAGPAHRRLAHRLTTFGLWMALTVCLAAMLPIAGHPFSLGFADAQDVGPATVSWHPVPRALAIASGAGLLLSSITAAPGRRSADAAPVA